MAKENIEVTYLLTTQIETPERSFELLLAEMTSGIQYVSTRQGVKMNRISESHGFTDRSNLGSMLTCTKEGSGQKRPGYHYINQSNRVCNSSCI